MSPDDERLAEAWRAAAADLGIRVTAPCRLTDRTGAVVELPAHVHDFGTAAGTIVGSMPATLPAGRLAGGVAYFFSLLNPALYGGYERQRFIAVLEAWGWSGRGEPPAWYRGEGGGEGERPEP